MVLRSLHVLPGVGLVEAMHESGTMTGRMHCVSGEAQKQTRLECLVVFKLVFDSETLSSNEISPKSIN